MIILSDGVTDNLSYHLIDLYDIPGKLVIYIVNWLIIISQQLNFNRHLLIGSDNHPLLLDVKCVTPFNVHMFEIAFVKLH